MAGDWIKMHRKLLHSAVASDMDMLGLWVALLLAVNWKTGWFKMREINPGQMAFSWRNLGERLFPEAATRPSVNRLRRMVADLARHRMVKVENVGRSYSVLTICNWGTYQSGVSATDTPSDTRPDTPSDTRPDTDRRRVKKEKKEKTLGAINFPPILDNTEFREALSAWLDYKLPKEYTPRGLKVLVTRAKKRAEAHGVQAVVEAFDKAQSNNYEGWDLDGFFRRNGVKRATGEGQQGTGTLFG